MNELKLHGYIRPILGTDPEMFFSRNGKIIGSEKVVPSGGVIYRHGITTLNANETGENKVIMDGVQVELNPMESQCRESLASNIVSCLKNTKDRLNEEKYKDVSLDLSVLIEVDQDEFDSLSGDSKRFGCMPSKNAYGEKKVANNVDPTVYRFRCAGGHIHLGKANADPNNATKVSLNEILEKRHEKLVKLMDVIVGNTCVLLDRDPGNVERRKVYGRAGEYRTPKHGVEYRTLSNFWLRSYPLMSLVMGLSRFAVNIMGNGDDFYRAIMSKIDTNDIRKAINENDFELAYKNFLKIENTILEMAEGLKSGHNGEDDIYGDYAIAPINEENIEMFKYLVKVGIDKYWNKDVVKNWTQLKNFGWEKWALHVAKPEMNKK